MKSRTPLRGILGQAAGGLGALAATAALVFIPVALGHEVPWGWFGAGALGWVLALALRLPIVLGPAQTRRRHGCHAPLDARAGWADRGDWCGWASCSSPARISRRLTPSGPAGRQSRPSTASRSDSFGSRSCGATTPRRLRRDKSSPRMGLDRDIAPAWGVVERLFAGAAHIGFTLLVGRWPLLVIALIPDPCGREHGSHGPAALGGSPAPRRSWRSRGACFSSAASPRSASLVEPEKVRRRMPTRVAYAPRTDD